MDNCGFFWCWPQYFVKSDYKSARTDVRDRRRKKIPTTKPKVERTIPNKFKWGTFEGASMSVEEITKALNAQGINTEEQWNNRSDEEMQRGLECCGAL